MKKFFILSAAALLMFTLTACAGSNAGKDVRVKCPACGYEFDVDSSG